MISPIDCGRRISLTDALRCTVLIFSINASFFRVMAFSGVPFSLSTCTFISFRYCSWRSWTFSAIFLSSSSSTIRRATTWASSSSRASRISGISAMRGGFSRVGSPWISFCRASTCSPSLFERTWLRTPSLLARSTNFSEP
jgi:hypothetical protein